MFVLGTDPLGIALTTLLHAGGGLLIGAGLVRLGRSCAGRRPARRRFYRCPRCRGLHTGGVAR